jgi:hypothetical protein
MSKDFNGLQGLVLADGHFGMLYLRADHVLILKRRDELLFSLVNHSHFELTFANTFFPPPVFVVGQHGGF